MLLLMFSSLIITRANDGQADTQLGALPIGAICLQAATLPGLEELFFGKGSMFLLTATKLVFNTATPSAVDGNNFTFDHDDSLLPGEFAGGTADGSATATP